MSRALINSTKSRLHSNDSGIEHQVLLGAVTLKLTFVQPDFVLFLWVEQLYYQYMPVP